MSRGPIVAVDGPAGSGKSTLARRLAAALGLDYVNTGLMYRALTRLALEKEVPPSDGEALGRLLDGMRFGLSAGESPARLTVEGEPPGAELLTAEVEEAVSAVSSHPEVRRRMRDLQRDLGARGAVMEGRDIGSVVFPDAEVKIFLVADTVERAARRMAERGGGAPDQALARALAARDERDARVNPFVPPPDAIRVDTSGRSADEVLEEALSVVRARLGGDRLASDRPGDAGRGHRVIAAPRLPRVAVVGRQNVGKSTLVNRLFGRREAIAHEQPGVTRDRVEITATWRGRSFLLVDTGGFLRRAGGIEGLVSAQAERAAAGADLVLLVVDAQTGIQEEDADLARRLQGAPVPVLLVANKVDAERDEADVAAFYGLGLGEPFPVSALHGRAAGDLLDRILEILPEAPAEAEVEGEPRFALVGRPNVGKSSLFNRLVGEERSVVFEEAGTTRDAVDAVVEWEAGPVRFVDTAGLRKAGRMQGLDYYGLVRSARAIDRSHVALLVIDAGEGVTADDKHIAARVMEAGRGLVVAANKWDLLPSEEKDPLFKDLAEAFVPFARAPVLRTSALSERGVRRIPSVLLDRHAHWSYRAPTSEVNRVLQEAQDERPPPRGVSRFRYGTQVSAGPPSFVLFGGKPPEAGYRRFLENRLRAAFALWGIPVRLRFRARRRSGPTPGPRRRH